MQLFIYFSLQVVDTITGQIFDKIHATIYTQQLSSIFITTTGISAPSAPKPWAEMKSAIIGKMDMACYIYGVWCIHYLSLHQLAAHLILCGRLCLHLDIRTLTFSALEVS